MDRKLIEIQLIDYLSSKSTIISKRSYTMDTDLFSEGLLDSLAFTEVIVFIEERYDISLNDETVVDRENFGTLSKMSELVSKAIIRQKK